MLSTTITSAFATAAALSGPALAAPTKAQFAGDITYYDTGLGACGQTHTNDDMIAAISKIMFDPHTPGGNPNENTLCNKRARVHYNGKIIEVTVVDRCEGCAEQDIDLSRGAFAKFEDPNVHGRLKGSWEWI
ncbi:hypothetical protein OQA88_6676 [Cercophora sp. LCS_1]